MLVGLSLGALGAGGSILTVPALVLILGQGPHEAAATSLVVVGTAATAGALAHYRRGAVRMRAGLFFAAAGVAGSLAGSYANIRTDPQALALAFSAIMIVAAMMLWRGAAEGSTGIHAPGDAQRVPTITRTALAGSGVGLLTGFFGIGGGFLAVPALTWALRLSITAAVGTSLLVIALNSAIALIPRIAENLIDPTVTAVFVTGGIMGAAAGTWVAHRVAAAQLKRAFAAVVLVTAACLAVSTLWA